MMDTQKWARMTVAQAGFDPNTFEGGDKVDVSVCITNLWDLAPHLLWMLKELLTMPADDKSNRWVGFIQGVMVAKGDISIEDAADLNGECGA